jgi:hypothetical protein
MIHALIGSQRQASQLSGGGDAVDRQSSRQPADRLSALSAEGLGRRRRAPQKSACSDNDPLSIVQDSKVVGLVSRANLVQALAAGPPNKPGRE